MKQNLATGRFLTLLIPLPFAFSFCLGACSRIPRNQISNTRQVETPTASSRLTAINLNTASAAELERLPGVGAVLAARIITHREAHGRFRRAEHLMMVRGISDRKFRELRSLVRVE